jgi:hypothetical protein
MNKEIKRKLLYFTTRYFNGGKRITPRERFFTFILMGQSKKKIKPQLDTQAVIKQFLNEKVSQCSTCFHVN